MNGFRSLIFLLAVWQLAVQGQEPGSAGSISATDTTLQTIDEGFTGENADAIDYDALVKELYGKTDEKQPEQTSSSDDQPVKYEKRVLGPAPGLLKKGIFHGSHLAFNGASPYAVTNPLRTWYSFIDASLTIKLPLELDVESIPLFLLFEISTFSFENSLPEGGVFSGLAYIMQTGAIGDHAGAVLGFGFWDASLGSMLELNYRFRPTRNTFFRIGNRGVLITNIESIGPAWWLELRLSLGLEL